MLGVLWTPEQDDASTVAIMRAGADELDAIEELMETVRLQAWPHKADDTYGLLAIHEATLKLPVKPAGVPVAARQDAVKSAIQGRRVGAAKRWVERLNTAMRGNPWSYERNTPGHGQITITIPYGEASFTAGQVQALAERVTPAHLEVLVRYDVGFIAGVSRTGDPI